MREFGLKLCVFLFLAAVFSGHANELGTLTGATRARFSSGRFIESCCRRRFRGRDDELWWRKARRKQPVTRVGAS